MAEADSQPKITPAHVLDAVAAGLWPTLSTDDRRERARQALGLEPLAAWTDGRMVYVEARTE
jgi:hypothetical protein